MARWDEILTLPVQNPPMLEFSSSDIVWSRVEGWRDAIDRVALIPFSRVDDFVRGESASKDCPTRFHVEARRRRPPEMPYKPKVDGILEYILYWCSFGPDDHRKGGVVRPSRVYNLKKNKTSGRPNTKRGCVCHFIVKRLIAEPTVALIIYNQDKHVDKKGLPCHGPLDKKAVGTRAMFAPYISDEARLRVLSLLHVGVPVETIMQRHNESVEKQGGPCNRDDLLTHRYVRRLERSIRRSTYELDPDDAVSVSMWVESHRNHIFFYEDFSDSEPFVVGIQTEWQLQQMIRFGNRSLVASDSRFGDNKLKYPVHSLLVFDSNNKAIPVAWIITPRFANADADRWIRALYDRVHSKDPNWKLAGFIIDDPSADILTIRHVLQCSVLICFWRVRHAWHKNLIAKCSDSGTRVEILKRLGHAVYSICKGNADLDSFEDFMEDFVDCSEFLDYFKAIWVPRMGTWTTALKTLPLASQAVSAAIESYHHQFKLRLLNEKDTSAYQRVDWLVDKLGTKVHSYYWLDEYSGKDDFARYRKDEWKSGLTSWQRALQIPDSDVVVECRCAKVSSQFNREYEHVVCNPGSEFAMCECDWSKMGNLCKHVIKVSQVYRDRGLAAPSMSLFNYNRILINMLHCPPHDSLIRDHAVSLAVCAQIQLNAIFNLENSKNSPSVSAPMEEATVNGGVPANDIPEKGDEEFNNDSQCTAANAFPNGDESGVHIVGSGEITDHLGGGDYGNVTKENVTGNMMDIDLVSVEASQSRLFKQQMADGAVPANHVLENCDKVLMNESHYTAENASSNGDASEVQEVICGEIRDDLGSDEAVGVAASDGGVCCNVMADDMVTMDVDQPSVEASQSSLVEQRTANGSAHTNDALENDNKVLVNESHCTAQNASSDANGSKVQEAIGGEIGDDLCSEKAVGVAPSDGGVCYNVIEETGTGSMMDVDPLPIRTSSSCSVPVKQPMVNGGSSANDISENGALDHRDEPSNDADSTSRDRCLDHIADEVHIDQAIEVFGCDNGVCGDDAVEAESIRTPAVASVRNSSDSASFEAVPSG
ncbi:uncharacterized protein LOC131250784 [Magnolia sinica]|uniref:uncharacterized protein LOC131250784 n=1 Tax=Magnolia sinica TaxID=86752 RepID=UPI0026581F4B|nr:uncharacterized protein LOC131250784 [Magnolia sinica]